MVGYGCKRMNSTVERSFQCKKGSLLYVAFKQTYCQRFVVYHITGKFHTFSSLSVKRNTARNKLPSCPHSSTYLPG